MTRGVAHSPELLAGTPWRIENRHQHGLYRLIADHD